MRIDTIDIQHWRAAVLIAAAGRDRDILNPLSTEERTKILQQHFSEMDMAEIVLLEAGAITVLRAILVLTRWIRRRM